MIESAEYTYNRSNQIATEESFDGHRRPGRSLSAGLAEGLDTATSSNASEEEPGKPEQEEQEIDIAIGETDMGILIPESRMSETEKSFLSCIPDKGMRKDYELIEYVNDVNREYTEVLMETNIDGRVSKAYTYGNERISIENSMGWKGYYLYDPRGSVSSVTNRFAAVSIAYRYTPTGEMTLGKPLYRNVYGYNGESYNPNTGLQYLRARYFQVEQGNFLTEDTYLGNLAEPLTLNRYNYVMSNPLNYIDPSGHLPVYNPSNAEPLPGYEPDDDNIFMTGIERVKELWGSISKGVTNAVDMISENVSRAVKDKVKDLMEAAVEASVIISCSDTVQLLNDVGNTIFSFIIGTVYGALEPASALLDFLVDSGGYDTAAFELGRVVGNAAAIAAILALFFTGAGAISGAFMGGAMSIAVGAAGAATVELVGAGATVIVVKGQSIAEAMNGLISEMSSASNSDGKGTKEKGDSDSDLGNYKFKEGIDEDLRGGKGTFEEALDKAFEKTGTPKEDFTVTKWGKDQYGKSHPVEWRASNGAEVSVDIGHSVESGAPTADHVGWQTGGKRSSGGGVRGHIFVDKVPYNR